MPAAVRQRHHPRPYQLQNTVNQSAIPSEANLQGVFQDFRKHDGGRFGADDGAVKAGGEQVGNAAHVVDVHVGDDQGADVIDGEIDGEVGGRGASGFFLALEQAAVDQYTGGGVCRWLTGPATGSATGSVPLGTDPNRTKPGVTRWQKGGV